MIVYLPFCCYLFSQDLLSNSRAADSGVKLEVNEKILDSCTGLMQAIRILVQKSRVLQAEIVAKGKVSLEIAFVYHPMTVIFFVLNLKLFLFMFQGISIC